MGIENSAIISKSDAIRLELLQAAKDGEVLDTALPTQKENNRILTIT